MLPTCRRGDPIELAGRRGVFSFWPVDASRRSLQSVLLASDPWSVISTAVAGSGRASQRREAESFVAQGKDYFAAARVAEISGAKPVLLYYAFLNIAKAFILASGTQVSLPSIAHGISDAYPAAARLDDAKISTRTSQPAGKLSAFAEFYTAYSGQPYLAGVTMDLPDVLDQIVTGHRLWRSAASKSELFVPIHDIDIMEDSGTAWVRLSIDKGDVLRAKIQLSQLIAQSGLDPATWQLVRDVSDDTVHVLEERQPLAIGSRRGSALFDAVSRVRRALWAIVSTDPPYRKYYLYLGQQSRLPQLLSMYAAIFYLGSVTRYRPVMFQKALQQASGSFIQELLSGLPMQFLYLIASAFVRRDVTRPNTVR